MFIILLLIVWFIDSKFVKGFDGVMERFFEFFVVFVFNRNYKCFKVCYGFWKFLFGIGYDEFGVELFLVYRGV